MNTGKIIFLILTIIHSGYSMKLLTPDNINLHKNFRAITLRLGGGALDDSLLNDINNLAEPNSYALIEEIDAFPGQQDNEETNIKAPEKRLLKSFLEPPKIPEKEETTRVSFRRPPTSFRIPPKFLPLPNNRKPLETKLRTLIQRKRSVSDLEPKDIVKPTKYYNVEIHATEKPTVFYPVPVDAVIHHYKPEHYSRIHKYTPKFLAHSILEKKMEKTIPGNTKDEIRSMLTSFYFNKNQNEDMKGIRKEENLRNKQQIQKKEAINSEDEDLLHLIQLIKHGKLSDIASNSVPHFEHPYPHHHGFHQDEIKTTLHPPDIHPGQPIKSKEEEFLSLLQLLKHNKFAETGHGPISFFKNSHPIKTPQEEIQTTLHPPDIHHEHPIKSTEEELLDLHQLLKLRKFPKTVYEPIPFFGASSHPLGIPKELEHQVHVQSDSFGPSFSPIEIPKYNGFHPVPISEHDQLIEFPIEMYKTHYQPVPVSGNVIMGQLLGLTGQAGHVFPIKGSKSVFGYTRSARFIGNILHN